LATAATAGVVIKIGGALIRDPIALAMVCEDLATLRSGARVVLVPGGGPFADTVRDTDRTIGLGSDAAHWMAILAMDQYAHLLEDRIPRVTLTGDPDHLSTEMAAAWRGGHIPVLAPYRWLRRADPVPHSWDATSDSIAAWIAITLRAAHLVLLKPVSGALAGIVDGQFRTVMATSAGPGPRVSVCTPHTLTSVIGSLELPAA
jgi:5-(aminomethyl)-3-furanmethanol phosphate kinase